jgi:hypothetical protein
VAPIDLYIVGSVAVSVDGTRLGKGKDGNKGKKLVLRSLLPVLKCWMFSFKGLEASPVA